ncbi:unnamed protein product [Orchesella dallaii]|uniref:Uncharacterized protein n=1 Tax=Orchesella dallaii TaxID=48710 RepID=A0ABP1SAL1_9HEXA
MDQLFQTLSTNPIENFEYEPTRLFGVGEFLRNKNSLAFKVESVREKFVIDSVELIQKLVEQQGKIATPFFPNNLCTILGIDGVDQDDGEMLALMLQRFGDQISSLHIGISRISPGITVQRLINSLNSLPFLKILQLEARIPRSELGQFNTDGLPNLPHLESLCVEEFGVQDAQGFGDGSELDPFLILPFLHRYGKQLTAFKCFGRLFDSNQISIALLNNLLPNLKLLKISYLNPYSMIKLMLLDWNLETLHLMGYTRYEKRSELFNPNFLVVGLWITGLWFKKLWIRIFPWDFSSFLSMGLWIKSKSNI